MVEEFTISATSDRFWNKDAFIEYLVRNAGCNIKLNINPEAICLHTLGVYKILNIFGIKNADIVTMNPLEKHDQHRITIQKNSWFQNLPTISSEFHSWSQKKLFLALYNRPTAARLTVGSYLLDNYSDITHLHFSMDTHDDNLLHFELDKSLQYDKHSIHRIGKLINQLPILLSPRDQYRYSGGYNYDDPLTNLYKDILIDVVVESHITGNSFFPTEKTIRPICLKKPFIVFSNYNYLEYLRQMGFRTFSNYWNENYDGFETTNRLHEIYRVIDQLACTDQKTLNEMYDHMQPDLEHNFNLLQEQKFSRKITKIV